MDAAGSFGEGHVETVIDENARRTVRGACFVRNAEQCFACERGGSFPKQILLAKLNPIYASSGYSFDLFQERIEQVFLGRGFEAAAVGYVTEDGLSAQRLGIARRAIWGGHWK